MPGIIRAIIVPISSPEFCGCQVLCITNSRFVLNIPYFYPEKEQLQGAAFISKGGKGY